MSTLQVANLWFESTSNNYISLSAANTISIVAAGAVKLQVGTSLTVPSTVALVANGSPGTNGQVLTTNASAIFWANSAGGTNIVTTVTDATSITPDISTTDIVNQLNTQTAGTLTINAPTGTPVDGEKLILRIKSTNVQTFAWNAVYVGSSDFAIPTATSGSALTDYMGFMYNTNSTKWHLLAKNFGF